MLRVSDVKKYIRNRHRKRNDPPIVRILLFLLFKLVSWGGVSIRYNIAILF